MAIKLYFANESEIIKAGLKSILSPNPLYQFCNESTYVSLQNDIQINRPNIIFVDAFSKNYDICCDLVNRDKYRNRLFIFFY